MGYMAELNTLLRLSKDFDASAVSVGKTLQVTKENERVFPLHVAMLLVSNDWTFYGYCVVHSTLIKDGKTILEFEVLSLFSPEEQARYKQKFLEAAKKTREISL